jgi:hypothetical protein
MPVLFRFVSPALANARFNGTLMQILDNPFGNTPCADPLVTVELYPVSPHTAVTAAQAFINSGTTNTGVSLTPVGVGGQSFKFRLGGNSAENPGQFNAVQISATATNGSTSMTFSETVPYYRMYNPSISIPFAEERKKKPAGKAKKTRKKK